MIVTFNSKQPISQQCIDPGTTFSHSIPYFIISQKDSSISRCCLTSQACNVTRENCLWWSNNGTHITLTFNNNKIVTGSVIFFLIENKITIYMAFSARKKLYAAFLQNRKTLILCFMSYKSQSYKNMHSWWHTILYHGLWL